MKTINLTVFSFDELSENVQKKIIERERWNVMEQCMDAYGGLRSRMGWGMRHLGGMSVDDAIMEILLERMIDISFEDETV